MSFMEIIDKIKGRVAAVDAGGPRKVVGVFQLNIKAADKTHFWICDLKNLEVNEGSTSSADVTLDIDEDTFVQVGSKAVSFADAEAAGTAVVTGNRALVAALAEVLK